MKPPGKYDDLSEALVAALHAEAVALIVVNGSRGSGFSVTVLEPNGRYHAQTMALALRAAASQLEADIRALHAARQRGD